MMLAMAGAVGSFFGQQEKVSKQEARLAQAADVQALLRRYRPSNLIGVYQVELRGGKTLLSALSK